MGIFVRKMILPFRCMMKNTLICLYLAVVLFPEHLNAQFHTLGTQSKKSNSSRTYCIVPKVSREVIAPLFNRNTVIDEPFTISSPLRRLLITSPKGFRKHPIDGVHSLHNGIDLRAHNDSVFSIMDGIVLDASYNLRSGVKIKIKHQSKLTSTYAHLSRIFVKTGQLVKSGECIAISGNTGMSNGHHLHFSIVLD